MHLLQFLVIQSQIANKDLKQDLSQNGYYLETTPGLWKRKLKSTSFTLIVDDFGTKYRNKVDFNHLIEPIKIKFSPTVDWTESKYIRIDLNWDYKKREI